MNNQDKQKLLEEWRGTGKIKALKKEFMRRLKKWRLHYEDGGKREFIDFENLETCEEFLIEFGGKNEDTVATPPIYLKLETFDVEEMLNCGHVLKRLSIKGKIPSDAEDSMIPIPSECGSPYFQGKASNNPAENVIIKKARWERFTTDTYRQFGNTDEAKRFINWILGNQHLKNYKWTVYEMVTLSKDVDKFCLWKRGNAGDGSKTMELQLKEINKTKTNDLMTADIMSAAGDLIHKECSLIDPKKAPSKAVICVDAFGAGKVDRNGHRIAGPYLSPQYHG